MTRFDDFLSDEIRRYGRDGRDFSLKPNQATNRPIGSNVSLSRNSRPSRHSRHIPDDDYNQFERLAIQEESSDYNHLAEEIGVIAGFEDWEQITPEDYRKLLLSRILFCKKGQKL